MSKLRYITSFLLTLHRFEIFQNKKMEEITCVQGSVVPGTCAPSISSYHRLPFLEDTEDPLEEQGSRDSPGVATHSIQPALSTGRPTAPSNLRLPVS